MKDLIDCIQYIKTGLANLPPTPERLSDDEGYAARRKALEDLAQAIGPRSAKGKDHRAMGRRQGLYHGRQIILYRRPARRADKLDRRRPPQARHARLHQAHQREGERAVTGAKFLDRSSGRLHYVVSEEGGIIGFRPEDRETIRYLGTEEFHRRFISTSIDRRAVEIADQVVPDFRGKRLSCTGPSARKWQAAYNAAAIALSKPEGEPTLAMLQAGCRALRDRDKGNCITIQDVKAIIAAAIGAVLSPVERWAMVFDGEEGWGMEPASDGEYVKFVDHAAASAMPKLFGPYGHLNGHRALNEESWAVEDDPMENSEEYFSIPLYALVEPIFPVMHGFPPDAQPFDGSKYGIEEGEEGTEPTVKIGERSYRKFIRHPEEVTDGTLRCIACGQIDEDGYHDDELCPGMNPTLDMEEPGDV